MLFLFNKTIKPLDQFAKKKKKKPKQVSLLGATDDNFFSIFDKIFSPNFFSVTHKFSWALHLCKVSEKGTRDSNHIYRG